MVDAGYLGLAAGYVAATLVGGFACVHLATARCGARGSCDDAAAWIAVALLGGAVALARFLLDAAVAERAAGPFPLGTLAVNLSGAARSAWSPGAPCTARR